MSILLHVRPDLNNLSWAQFLEMTAGGRYCCALDGIVADGPIYELHIPRFNANHHHGVVRLATRATCAQVLMLHRQGLLRRFHRNGRYHIEIWVNDCDHDVCLATFMLMYPEFAESLTNPLLHRLVHLEDMFDTTNGAFPVSEYMYMLGLMAWIFQPYDDFRALGGLATRDALKFRSVITDVHERIKTYLTGGKFEPLEINMDFTELPGGGTEWSLVQEQGGQARLGMLAKGITACVSVRSVGERSAFTIVKLVEGSVVPIDRICTALNALEITAANQAGFSNAESDLWGGGDTVIGSPRIRGFSLLDLSVVTAIVEEKTRERLTELA